jgi:trans-2,3-dihydro-3-hydroxyanthranilate isomerase
MRYRYFICDVFTTERFGGNQLAVLPEADGLSGREMRSVAREFNYSESTFVARGDDRSTRKVRIYTPTAEIPFAGHPNIGTAFALARAGEFGDIGAGIVVTFAEGAGPVPVSVCRDDDGRIYCELTAPQALSLGASVDATRIATALSVGVDDIVTSTHAPQVASVGLPFVIVELASHDALKRARADIPSLERLRDEGIVPDVHAYCRSGDGFDLRARMFAPLDGVPEDPATGSANCALAALLTHRDERYASGGSWRIAQGVEMGRPSTLYARTQREGSVVKTWIGGHSVFVAEGFIEID